MPTTSPSRSISTSVSMKAAGVRAIDPIADPNTRTRNVYLTLNDPPAVFRLGATVSVTFSRPVARARRPAGDGAAREGRQDLRLDGRSGQEHGVAARGHRRRRARATASSSPPASRPASASSLPACTASAAGQVGQGAAMNGFNLSTWALQHRSFVWYLMLLIVVAGGLSYTRLGREEDPAFTIKTHGGARRAGPAPRSRR